MNGTLKQSIIDLLEAAKAHIEAGEHNLAVEKIENAVAVIENEDVASMSTGDEEEEDGDGGKIKDPLPGQGTNGPE